MTDSAIVAYLLAAFPDVQAQTAKDTTYFFIGEERKMPFVTLVRSDEHEKVSNLDRDGVFRLNIGIRRTTYEARFGPPPPWPAETGIVNTGHDFTTLDELMPHPVYASMGWVCVLSPSDATLEEIKPLLAEAHAQASG